MNFKSFALFALSLILFVSTPHSVLAQTNDLVHTISNSKLSETQIKNLFAFARVYGFVKYFYPLPKKDKINWSYIAAHGSQCVLEATSEEELEEALRAVFSPIAPLLKIHNANQNISASGQESSKRYYYNLHKGLGQDKAALPLLTRKISGLYKSQLMHVDRTTYLDLVAQNRLLSVDSLYSVQLTEKLGCSLPLVLTDSNYKQNKAHRDFSKKYQLNLDQHKDRLATIIIFWNVFQHFHPYLDSAAEWDSVFVKTMQQLSSFMTQAEFIGVARNLTTSLNDGHAYLAYTNSTGIYKRPTAPVLETAWVENQLVVSKVNIENTTIQQGDVIQKVDTRDAKSLVDYYKRFLSNSNPENGDLLAAQVAVNWLSSSKDYIAITLTDSSGNTRAVTLNGQDSQFKATTPTAAIRALEGGVYYVNTSTVSTKEFKENLTALQQAKGIVFDMRARPSGSFLKGVLPYLIEKEVETGNWSIPHYTFPDQRNVHFEPTEKWSIKPNGSYLSPKKAFLIGHNTLSYGETCAELVDHYKLGTKFGGSTAGTNGDMNFSGAGQLQVTWTGMKVLKRDGSPYHGIGVIPDIMVQPQLKDIRIGKDTQLEAAVEFLHESK
jgi:C-terminal processing protease CtpA/Prc